MSTEVAARHARGTARPPAAPVRPSASAPRSGAPRAFPGWAVPLAVWLLSSAVMAFYLRRALRFFEQTDRAGDAEDRGSGGSFGWRMLPCAGLGAFTLALVMLVRPRMGGAMVLNFVLPGAAVPALIAWTEGNAPARYPHARRVGDMTMRWRNARGERTMDGGVR